MEQDKGLRIVSLAVENIKRIKAISITPDGNSIIIGGANGAGKSSTLDAIAYALGGQALIPDQPIRKGEKTAKITVDLGKYIVERRFTEKGSTLVVKGTNGAKFPSPQAILDSLVGDLTFDPLAFATMKPADQLVALKKVVGLDFSALDEQYNQWFTERTSVNREVKQLEGQLAGLTHHEDVPDSPITTEDLVKELQAADERQRWQRDFTELIATIADLTNHLRQAEKDRDELNDRIMSAGPARSMDVIRESMANAEATNAKIRDNQTRRNVELSLADKQGGSDGLTLQLATIAADKEAQLAVAAFPVPGLSFGDAGVLLNGLPLEQAAASEKFKVSIAMGMALNPELKIMLMRDASLLDETNLQVVTDLVKVNGYQAWIERVGEGKEISVIIEAGEVQERGQD